MTNQEMTVVERASRAHVTVAGLELVLPRVSLREGVELIADGRAPSDEVADQLLDLAWEWESGTPASRGGVCVQSFREGLELLAECS